MEESTVIEEGCECGGTAKLIRWFDGNLNWRIPILKCDKCGDTFDAHEDSWVEKHGG